MHDVMLYGFLISADPGALRSRSLAERYLERELDADPASHADAVLSLYQKLRPEIEALGLTELYESIDLPLVRVLARMEDCGVRVDPDQLRVLSVPHGRGDRDALRLRFTSWPARPSISILHNN